LPAVDGFKYRYYFVGDSSNLRALPSNPRPAAEDYPFVFSCLVGCTYNDLEDGSCTGTDGYTASYIAAAVTGYTEPFADYGPPSAVNHLGDTTSSSFITDAGVCSLAGAFSSASPVSSPSEVPVKAPSAGAFSSPSPVSSPSEVPVKAPSASTSPSPTNSLKSSTSAVSTSNVIIGVALGGVALFVLTGTAVYYHKQNDRKRAASGLELEAMGRVEPKISKSFKQVLV